MSCSSSYEEFESSVQIVDIEPTEEDLACLNNMGSIDIDKVIGLPPGADYSSTYIHRNPMTNEAPILQNESSTYKESDEVMDFLDKASNDPSPSNGEKQDFISYRDQILCKFANCLINAKLKEKSSDSFLIDFGGETYSIKMDISKAYKHSHRGGLAENGCIDTDESLKSSGNIKRKLSCPYHGCLDKGWRPIDSPSWGRKTKKHSSTATRIHWLMGEYIMPHLQTPRKCDSDNEDIIEGTPQKVISPYPSFNISALSISQNETLCSQKKGVIASSGISSSEKILVKRFCEMNNFIYTDSRSKTYSILVFRETTGIDGCCTFRYFVALASQAYIVTINWIIQSLRADFVLPLNDFIIDKERRLTSQRAKMHPLPLLSGITLITELLTDSDYPGPEAIRHLLNLTGATVINNISELEGLVPSYPRFVIFQDENELTSPLLEKCSRYSVVAVGIRWIYDCLQQWRKLPVDDYLSMTFFKSPETVKLYHLPSDLLTAPYST